MGEPIDSCVVRDNRAWPECSVKRAGLSAFGFGGTNAHAIFEEYKSKDAAPVVSKPIVPMKRPKLTIVGMACRFGALENLDAVERAVYNGTSGACDLPEKRWRFFPRPVDGVRGCFVENIDVDYKRLRLPLRSEDQLQPQQLMALSVIDKALLDSGIEKGGNVAVLVGLGTDMELYRHRERLDLRERLHMQAGAKLSQHEKSVLQSVADPGTSISYTSNIGNVIATRISSAWGFTGPAFTITQGSNSVYCALDAVSTLFASGEIDAAVIAGVDMSCSKEALHVKTKYTRMSRSQHPVLSFDKASDGFFPGEGAGALVIKRAADVKTHEKQYATADAVAVTSNIEQSAQNAMSKASIRPEQVEYVELSADGDCDDQELVETAAAYGSVGKGKRVAVGSVKTSVGDTLYASGAAALIKSALCLYNRTLPIVPHWSGPKEQHSKVWDESQLYVCSDSSRAWVKNKGDRRVLAVNGISETSPGSAYSVIMSDVAGSHEEGNRVSLDPNSPKLVVIRGKSSDEIIEAISTSLRRIDMNGDAAELSRLLQQTISSKAKSLVLCIIATESTLKKELLHAKDGVIKASKSGKMYKRPSGSCFIPSPSYSDRIAFAFGDGASSYCGIGKDLYRIAPMLHELIQERTTDMWSVSDEAWNVRAVLPEYLDAQKEEFKGKQVDLFRSGVFFSVCFSLLARKVFNIKPKAAMGLSMGEVSMLFAFSQRNSKQSDEMISRLNNSPAWTSQLAVRFDALRRAWNIADDAPVSSFWAGYVLHARKDAVTRGIQHLGKRARFVRLVIVNDENTCLIGGVPEQCEALVAHLGAPQPHVIRVW